MVGTVPPESGKTTGLFLHTHECETPRSALYSSPAKIEHSPTDFQSSSIYLKTQP